MGTHYRGSAAEVRALDAFIKLMRSSATVAARMNAAIRRHELNENQFGVLETLLHVGPLSQCDLGSKLFTSRPNVTLVVDQLEERGLVVRKRSSRDRRSVQVSLSPAGRRLIERIFPEHAAKVADAFSALTAVEQEELGRICRKLGRSPQARTEAAYARGPRVPSGARKS